MVYLQFLVVGGLEGKLLIKSHGGVKLWLQTLETK